MKITEIELRTLVAAVILPGVGKDLVLAGPLFHISSPIPTTGGSGGYFSSSYPEDFNEFLRLKKY